MRAGDARTVPSARVARPRGLDLLTACDACRARGTRKLTVRAGTGGRRGSIFTVSIYTDQPSSACIRKTRTKLLGFDVARRPGRRGATGGGKKRIAKEMAKVLGLLSADDRRRCNNTYCYTNDAPKSFIKVDSPPRGVASPRPNSATSRPRLESGHCETLMGSHAT